MPVKHRLLAWSERCLNRITRPLRLRVLLLPEWALHGQEVSFRTDGLVTSHAANFLTDARFQETVAALRREIAHPVYHLFRLYVLLKLAEAARQVPDSIFVECGAGEGCAQLAINLYLKGPIPPTFMIDTFSGIDPRYLEKRELHGLTPEQRRDEALRFYSAFSYETVARRFAQYSHVHLVKGSVPDVLAHLKLERISWLHIDMNNAYPEYCALKFFYPQVTSPGFILFDDYGAKHLYPQKEAIDKACVELGIAEPISLPTGQGLIIKTAAL